MNYDNILIQLFFDENKHLNRNYRKVFCRKNISYPNIYNYVKFRLHNIDIIDTLYYMLYGELSDDYFIRRTKCTNRPITLKYTKRELEWLNNRFDDSESLKETFYRILNNVHIKPKCKFCDNFAKFNSNINDFSNTCENKQCINNQKKSVLKENLIKTYGVDNVSKIQFVKDKIRQTNINKYGGPAPICDKQIKEKIKQTNLKRYGCENPWNNDKQKQTMIKRYGCVNPSLSKEIQNKRKNTFINNYGVDNPAKNEKIKDKIKQTNIERYGYENVFQCPKIKSKIDYNGNIKKGIETKLKNGSYMGWTSKEEQQIFEILKSKFPKTLNHHFNSDVYPFNCDFYIPEIDTWIEYQGFWTHGNHPYNPNSDEDNNVINKWKANNHIGAIENWTTKDPLKRETAKKNNLKWLEFFTFKEFQEWFDAQ